MAHISHYISVGQCCPRSPPTLSAIKGRGSYFKFPQMAFWARQAHKSNKLLPSTDVFKMLWLSGYISLLRGQIWTNKKCINPQQIAHLAITIINLYYLAIDRYFHISFSFALISFDIGRELLRLINYNKYNKLASLCILSKLDLI